MLVYPSGVDVSSSALRFLSTRLRQHRRAIGSRWRRLSVGSGPARARPSAGGAHIHPARSRIRHRNHDRLPVRHRSRRPLGRPRSTLADAVRTASTKPFVILDGTLLPIDRIAADRPFYSGKHKKHRMNVQVLTDPFGRLLWASPALPGAVHDVRAAREHGIVDALAEAGVTCWADKACRGAGGTVRTPYWGRWETLSNGQKAVNRSHAKIRALVEQAMATLKAWRLLRKIRCSTTRITALVQAILTLHLASSER